jgi:CYTH domain-containing protein
LTTTLYVSEAEYDVFRTLPAAVLVKTRYNVPPFGIDVFTGALAGLVLAEIEFDTDAGQDEFPAPHESVAEATLDGRFTGLIDAQLPSR